VLKIGTSPSDLDLFLPKAARGPTRSSRAWRSGTSRDRLCRAHLLGWGRRRPRPPRHI